MPFPVNVQDVTIDSEGSEYEGDYAEASAYAEASEYPEHDVEDEYTEEDEEDIYEQDESKKLQDIKVHIPGITLFYGATLTGKSVLMKHLLYLHAKKFDQIYVFQGCPTDDWKCFTNKYVFKIDSTTDSKLKVIIEGAKQLKKQNKHSLIIIDDPFNGSADYHKSKIWQELSTMSRHSLTSIWMSVQNPGLIPPVLKGNLAGFFITKVAENHIKKIYEYSQGFSKVSELLGYLNKCEQGKVFYNDLRNPYGIAYSMVQVPYPPPKFMVRFN